MTIGGPNHSARNVARSCHPGTMGLCYMARVVPPVLPFARPRNFLFNAPSGVLFGGSLGVHPGDLRLVLV